MKIGIIGGGFYGCYIAKKLSSKHKVTIIDKNASILMEAANIINIGYIKAIIIPEVKKQLSKLFRIQKI